MKSYVEGMTAHHDGARVFKLVYDNRPGGATSPTRRPITDRLLAIPETGRKLLFVNPEYTSHINGVSRDESTAILNYLYAQIGLPQYSMRRSVLAQEFDRLLGDNCRLARLQHIAV